VYLTVLAKGKVETGIEYVQDNALKGHTFASLDPKQANTPSLRG
jgi:hypothetical protein